MDTDTFQWIALILLIVIIALLLFFPYGRRRP